MPFVDLGCNTVDNSFKIISNTVIFITVFSNTVSSDTVFSNTVASFGPCTVDSATVLSVTMFSFTVVSRTVVSLFRSILQLERLSLKLFPGLPGRILFGLSYLVPPKIDVEISLFPGVCTPLASPFTGLDVPYKRSFLPPVCNIAVAVPFETDVAYLQSLTFVEYSRTGVILLITAPCPVTTCIIESFPVDSSRTGAEHLLITRSSFLSKIPERNVYGHVSIWCSFCQTHPTMRCLLGLVVVTITSLF